MSPQDYWDKKHTKLYVKEGWINKPSLFAEWSLQFLPTQGTLLDLGMGQGQDSRFFAGNNFAVTATDFSESAIELAKNKSSSKIQFEQLDFSKPLPYADESFDVAYSHLALHYFDTKGTNQLFSEIRRVLKQGGVLAALFNSTSDPELAEGETLEKNFIQINGITKRYFDSESARRFANGFDVIVADDQGTTYKDELLGVRNLVRLVAKKP